MKRIWIAGNAGSGKTTLARFLGKSLGLPVFHRDAVTWDAGFQARPEEEQLARVREITAGDRWIFEGARFTASKEDGRLDRCDTLVHLDLNRFLCLWRVWRRSRIQKAGSPSGGQASQPFDAAIARYILREYPGKRGPRDIVLNRAREKGIHVIILSTAGQVDGFRRTVHAMSEPAISV